MSEENCTISPFVAANSLWSHRFASLLRETGYSLPQEAKTDPLHKGPGPMCLNKEAELSLLQGNPLPKVP